MKTNMLELSSFVKWSVAGDGAVSNATNNRNAHYAISRLPRHWDYIEQIKQKLSSLPDCSIRTTEFTRKDNGVTIVQLTTASHPLFSRIRKRQYVNGHRVLDPHMMSVVNWERLAYLYQDDGSLVYNTKGSSIVRISTCAYSYYEQMALRKCFIEKFGLCFNVNKTGRKGKHTYQLNLRKNDQEKFFENIFPYCVKSYHYKFPASFQEEASQVDDDLVCLCSNTER